MNPTTFPDKTIKRETPTKLSKAAILLTISLGLFWFSNSFPVYRFLAPDSAGWRIWFSYAKDLIQPFAFYFFLCLGERWLKPWQGRALLAFGIPTLLEFGQYLYDRIASSHYVGSFDPMDVIMYAISVGTAVLVEQKVFARKLKFW